MKSKLLLFLLVFSTTYSIKAQIKFKKYFINKTLRVDYIIAGDNKSETVYLKQLKQEPNWGGSTKNLVDKFNYGYFKYKAVDIKTNKVIYSKGFCSLFQEWQSTAEAKKMKRAYYHVSTLPFPKNKIKFIVEKRDWNGKFNTLFETEIDPKNYFINKETPRYIKSSKVFGKKTPDKAVDIAFIAEGYTKNEMEKFRRDVKRIANNILNVEPFKKHRKDFNIYALEAISSESGPDIPGKGIYKKTACNFSFYTFDSERYLTTSDLKTLHDIAANVPYDQIYVIVNTKKYGGGGIYNYYNSTMSDHYLTETVAVHEFGHGFVGLADEYFNTSNAYTEYYNLKIEPWEANITTLVNFESKWKNMLNKNTPIPTQRKPSNKHKVGVYEGGGYTAKGVYSPQMDCMMRSNTPKKFCPVCQRAIEEMILFKIGK